MVHLLFHQFTQSSKVVFICDRSSTSHEQQSFPSSGLFNRTPEILGRKLSNYLFICDWGLKYDDSVDVAYFVNGSNIWTLLHLVETMHQISCVIIAVRVDHKEKSRHVFGGNHKVG
jgi:hypothetical protein